MNPVPVSALLRQLEEDVTEAPWLHQKAAGMVVADRGAHTHPIGSSISPANRPFIAAARNAWPALTACVEALEEIEGISSEALDALRVALAGKKSA